MQLHDSSTFLHCQSKVNSHDNHINQELLVHSLNCQMTFQAHKVDMEAWLNKYSSGHLPVFHDSESAGYQRRTMQLGQ